MRNAEWVLDALVGAAISGVEPVQSVSSTDDDAGRTGFGGTTVGAGWAWKLCVEVLARLEGYRWKRLGRVC
jgi:hypothetical protein